MDCRVQQYILDQERTGGAQSTKTCKRWGWAGRKQRWQILTDTDGVEVWPNGSTWMRDESGSRSRNELNTMIQSQHLRQQS